MDNQMRFSEGLKAIERSEMMQLLYQQNIMQDSTVRTKPHSESLHLEEMTKSRSMSLSSKQGNILQIQSQVRKLKQIVDMQNELRRNRQELLTVNNQISECESSLKVRRMEALKEKIAEMQKKKNDRENQNKQSNLVLAKLKEGHKLRRKKMESIINLYKQEYDQVYHKKIERRRQEMKLDMEEIKQHQAQYLKVVSRKRSYRIKTENYDRKQEKDIGLSNYMQSRHQHSPSANSHEAKIERTKELIQKRKDYGENAERAALSVKVTKQMVKKANSFKSKHGYDANIDFYENQKKKLEKPRLDTNFSGDIEQLQSKEVNKIAQDGSPVKDKLSRLRNLAEGYMVKYENGHDEVLNKMCNINVLRAQLLLKET